MENMKGRELILKIRLGDSGGIEVTPPEEGLSPYEIAQTKLMLDIYMQNIMKDFEKKAFIRIRDM